MDIVMPKMGESINEGTIIKWHKKVGDQIKKDEIIFEISTDKVDTEIPSPSDGTLKEIKVNEGDTVEVGTVVAIVDSNGTATSNTQKEQKAPTQVEEKKEPDIKNEVQNKPISSNGELIEIPMPKMGESVMEGTIIKWHKKVGDNISKDETLFEISTDKVDTEVPSPVAGTIAEILIGEQETVEVGTIVAKVSTSGKVAAPKVEKTTESKTEETKQQPESMHDNFAKQVDISSEKKQGIGSVFYSPLVLSIAQKENVSFDELRNIIGTGLENRITKKDILTYIENRNSGKVSQSKEQNGKKEKTSSGIPAPAFAPSLPKTIQTGEGIEKIPMDNIRMKIMEHMVNSRDTSVHVTSMIEVDMARIHNFINENKESFQQKLGVKLTYMAFISYACVKALQKYPLMNSTIDGNNILQKNFVNLGIAVAMEPTGLIVPNIKNADQLNLIGLAKSVNDLAQRSRNKKLTPDDISGGTFTVTNYGVFGTVFGTPIINQPEVAILGVGAVIKRPVVVEVDGTDSIAIRPVMDLTLAHDHRLIDGMLGGLFLKHLKDSLEQFDFKTI
jgi:pyruvate dehydrogenase E2 component (dihydrolipoyllysine-residue acetyltransferase)